MTQATGYCPGKLDFKGEAGMTMYQGGCGLENMVAQVLLGAIEKTYSMHVVIMRGCGVAQDSSGGSLAALHSLRTLLAVMPSLPMQGKMISPILFMVLNFRRSHFNHIIHKGPPACFRPL